MSAHKFPEATSPVAVKNHLQPLSQWASSPSAESDLEGIFGPRLNWATAFKHLAAFRCSDFSLIPPVRILPASDMPGLWGGYSRDTREIYLSADCPREILSAVLIEEIGHFLDQELCDQETPGDEGAVFAALVIGGEAPLFVDEEPLAEVCLNGSVYTVEAAPRTRGNGTAKPKAVIVPTVPDTTTSSDGSVVYANKDSVRIVQSRANQRLVGSKGNDTFVVNNASARIEDPNGGTDTVESSVSFSLLNLGAIENLTLTGTANLNATGNINANSILGNAGNNSIDAQSGNDTVRAGAGNDTVFGGVGNDSLSGEDGNDSLDGSLDNDILLGGNGNDTLLGGSGNDSLNGDADNDILDGGVGIDTLVGGAGNDTYYVENVFDIIQEAALGGTDALVTTQRTFTLENYTNVENLFFSGTSNGVTFTGNTGNNLLTGTSGADSLSGSIGADTLVGGAGNDTYLVDNSGDRVIENPNSGKDLVISTAAAYVLDNNVENLALAGTVSISGTGNSAANSLLGNNANNTLSGLDGNDYIVGDNQLPSISLTGRTVTDVAAGYLLNGTNALVNNLGTPSGITSAGSFGERVVTRGDDNSSSAIDITTIFGPNGLNLYGKKIKSIFINTNGNITFDGSLSTFNPLAIDASLGTSIIAPFWADVDTRSGRSNLSAGGNSAGTNLVYWDIDEESRVLTITWDDVRYFGQQTTGENADTKVNAFQIQLIDSGEGNAFIVFRYENIDWTTGSFRSGGTNGLGGQAARAGFNTGTGRVIELPQSGDDLSVLDLDKNLPQIGLNSGQPGVYVFEIRNGEFVENIGGNDSLLGGLGNDTLLGNGGNDTLLGEVGDDSLDGGAGVDSMVGGSGNDTYIVDNSSDKVVEDSSLGGNDTVLTSVSYTLGGGYVENLTLLGTNAIHGTGDSTNNTITGNASTNSLDGGAGNDLIDGGAGIDTIIGGLGNDTILYNGEDALIEREGEGTDWVLSSVSYSLAANFEQLVLTGEAVFGVGNALSNTLTGNSLSNSLDGGTGFDSLIGGQGDDTYIVNESSDVVLEREGEGTDIVFSTAHYTLSGNVEHIQLLGNGLRNAAGNSLNNSILGNSGNNSLFGLDGNDTLQSGGGADTLVGGSGNDVYLVDTQNIIIVEAAGSNSGTDTIISSKDFNMSSGFQNIENLELAGSAISAIGSSISNIISGNNFGNILSGGSGNDTLRGRVGNDSLNGGDGADLLLGGSNLITGDEDSDSVGNDILIGGLGADSLDGGAGNDLLLGGTQTRLGATDSDSSNDTLLGGAGSDSLDGGGGADSLVGGLGDDYYLIDASDVVYELDGEGTDTAVSFQTIDLQSQTQSIENILLLGTASIHATGNELQNLITGNLNNNSLTGNAGDDTLIGLDGRDSLIGGDGYDSLDGGLGQDYMKGGAGNDTYVVEDRRDTIAGEEAGDDGGVDTVETSVNFDPLKTSTDSTSFASLDTLSFANLENFVFKGPAIRGVGNSLGNVFTGNERANIMLGLGGADTLIGGAGGDSLYGEAVYGAEASLNPGAYASGHAFDGAADNDFLDGGEGNDLLDGGQGADIMLGGAGNDTIFIDNAEDVGQGGVGTDEIYLSIDRFEALESDVENLTLEQGATQATANSLGNLLRLRQNAAATLRGLDGNDTILGYYDASNEGTRNFADSLVGDNGNDYIDGGLGADTMEGGFGDDVYVVDNASDAFREYGYEDGPFTGGIDTVITKINNFALSDIDIDKGKHVENIILAVSVEKAAGNRLDNSILGNAQSNSLVGGSGNDTLNDGGGFFDADILEGGDGNDVLIVDTGKDFLDGGAGADTFIGTAANDTIVVDDANDKFVDATGGFVWSKLESFVASNLGVESASTLSSDVFSSFNVSLLGGAKNATGNIYSNQIFGNALGNILDGGSDKPKNQTLSGGTVVKTNSGSDDYLYGFGGNDTLITASGDDLLDGGTGIDSMSGGDGDDVYLVDDSSDKVVEAPGQGVDLVRSSTNYTLSDNVEYLHLTGSNVVNGQSSSSYFYSSNNFNFDDRRVYTDSIHGTGNSSGNAILGNEGNNSLDGAEGDDTLEAAGGNDTLIGGAGRDYLYGGAGDDYFVIDSNDAVVDGGYGQDTDTALSESNINLSTSTSVRGVENIELRAQATLAVGSYDNNKITGNSLANWLDGYLGDDTLIGNSLADTLIGGAGYGKDSLFGAGGDDSLIGGLGADTLLGGAGNDTLLIDEDDSSLDGGDGAADWIVSPDSFSLAASHVASVENLLLTGNALTGTGTSVANTLVGNGLGNTLDGGNDADSLSGEAGDDRLIGGEGVDTLKGGAGNDTLVTDGSDTLDGGEGSADWIESGVTISLADAKVSNVENLQLTGFSAIQGTGNSGNNSLFGNTGANTLLGGEGDDTLSGGEGIDSLSGGGGNDYYILDSESEDQILESSAAGTDTIESSVSYNLLRSGSSQNQAIENLILTGNAISATGNSLANAITGNAQSNVISGDGGFSGAQSGADTLRGMGGSDTLSGDDKADLIFGGNNTILGGDDTDASGDLLQGGSGADTLDGGAGNDILIGGNNGFVGMTDSDDSGDTLFGGAGDDTLDGGLGSDSMVGGKGNDLYYIDREGDSVVELDGEGVDAVLSQASVELTNKYANVENAYLIGMANVQAIGNNSKNLLVGNIAANTLSGLAGDDTLAGGDGADSLLGGEGYDSLDGGLQADTMSGGAGNDTYVVDDRNDWIVGEAAGLESGIDTVETYVNFDPTQPTTTFEPTATDSSASVTKSNSFANLDTLSFVNLENFVFKGEALRGVGNLKDNVFTGNALDNVMLGLGGADTLLGGAGNDSLFGESDATTSGLPTLISGGDAGVGQDYIEGGSGDDYIDGGARADIMVGGTGNDTLNVDNIEDVVVEAAGGGTDMVVSSVNVNQLTANVENLTLVVKAQNATLGGGSGQAAPATLGSGNEADNILSVNYETVTGGSVVLRGLGGNDTLLGGTQAESLLGGDGSDYIDGGIGADTLEGGFGNDTLVVDSTLDAMREYGVENGSEQYALYGRDWVLTSVSIDLGDDTVDKGRYIENLIGTTPFAGLSLSGNRLDNVISVEGSTVANTLAGKAGNDTLLGGSGNDSLIGGAGIDSLVGGAGDDTYVISDASDTIFEAAAAASGSTVSGGASTSGTSASGGTDLVQSSISYTLGGGVEKLELTGSAAIHGSGNSLANSLLGNSGDNSLFGGEEDDTLNGGLGKDTLLGGAGDDLFVVNSVDDLVVENAAAGSDTVTTEVNGYTLTGNVENLILGGFATLSGSGNSLANSLLGNSAANTLSGDAGDDTLIGLAGNDSLAGGEGNDSMVGGEGSDTLDGGAGANTLSGGTGDDAYVINSVEDEIIESTLSGGGTDTATAKISGYTLAANVENLVLADGVGSGTGNSLANVITGNSGANRIDGGAGADTLVGNGGTDTFVVDNISDSVVGGAGTDLVESAVNFALGSNLENLALTGSAIIGYGNDLGNILTGNFAWNVLYGLGGDDSLFGGYVSSVSSGTSTSGTTLIGAGVDSLFGGEGNDTYVVTSVWDAVIENADQGTDWVQSEITYALTGNVEHLILTGIGNNNATGNGLSNSITGNAGDNRIDGGEGVDTLSGGAGNDTFVYDNEDYSIDGGSGSNTLQTTFSINLANLADQPVAISNISNLLLSGNNPIHGIGNSDANAITGNAFANSLAGGAGADTLSGGAGSDTLDGGTGVDRMLGGSGDDLYFVDETADKIIESFGEGTDEVWSSANYTLSSNIEKLTLTGTTATTGTGNESANTLVGNSLDNTFFGAAGDDYIDGGLGVDSLIGGRGNDTYVLDDGADTINEEANQGTDLVLSSATFTLSDVNLENLTLTGTSAINGTGNSQANILVGNSLANKLDGLAGADTLSGGLGDDTLVVDDSGDVTIETLAGGTDLIQSSVSWTLGEYFENLELTGTATLSGTGNSLSNSITGNSVANSLDGGGGIDTLVGLNGNDTYFVDSTDDSVIESLGGGTDLVIASVSGYTLADQVENLLLANGVISGTGNSLGNSLTGNSLGNSLDGGIGADTLSGGAGNDTYVVDNTADTITGEGETDGAADVVLSSITYTLVGNLENLVLSGADTISGFGSSVANYLLGNVGKNSLFGAKGNDTLDGGAENDTLVGEDDNDLLLGGLGNDSLSGGSGEDTLNGGSGSDVLNGGAGNDYYIVDSLLDDSIIEDALSGGVDTIESSIDFSLIFGTGFLAVENLILSGSAISATGSSLANILAGNSRNNILTGNAGADTIYGKQGSDNIDGGTENDLLFGGTNTSLGGNDDDTGNDNISGGLGKDSLDGGKGNDTLKGGEHEDILLGGDGNDLLLGDTNQLPGQDILGVPANDTLIAGDGDDTLDGGGGTDSLIGGLGDDLIYVRSTSDVVVENSGSGRDTLISGFSINLSSVAYANFEVVALFGSGNNTLGGNGEANLFIGNLGDNTLAGLLGNDTLYGGAGLDSLSGGDGNDYLDGGISAILDFGDTMNGGIGNDVYVVDNRYDWVIEDTLPGSVDDIDTVYTYINFDPLDAEDTNNVTRNISFASKNIESFARLDNFVFMDSATSPIRGVGNAKNNHFTGNAENNVILGLGGDDTVLGNAGNDSLYGDAENILSPTYDSLAGAYPYNPGDYDVSSLALADQDLLIGMFPMAGRDYLVGGDGNDLLSGNGGNDILLGGTGSDSLIGGSGIDSMVGGAGGDAYYIDDELDVMVELANEGTDTVLSDRVNIRLLQDNIENIVLYEDVTFGDFLRFAVGNSADNVISIAQWDSTSDPVTLTGGVTLSGGDGNDKIYGYYGSPTVAKDRYADDYLVGGSGNDYLDGGRGADILEGGLGNDTICVDTTQQNGDTDYDKIWEFNYEGDPVNGGQDWVISKVDIDLKDIYTDGGLFATQLEYVQNGMFIENLQGSGKLYGNWLNNIIIGGAGDDSMRGEAGNDSLYGGKGNDSLDGGTGSNILDAGSIPEDPSANTEIDWVTGSPAIKNTDGIGYYRNYTDNANNKYGSKSYVITNSLPGIAARESNPQLTYFDPVFQRLTTAAASYVTKDINAGDATAMGLTRGAGRALFVSINPGQAGINVLDDLIAYQPITPLGLA